MNEKFNENAKVEKFTNILGIAVRLIVIDPYPKRVILSLFRVAPSPAFQTEIMMADKLVKRGCNSPPPSQLCAAYDFGIERCVFPFSRGTGFACIVSKDSAALYASFLNSRIEKKEPWKETQTDSKK